MIHHVQISEKAKKALKRIPAFIGVKLQDWVEDVEERGLETVRKVSGYHDEPCKGALTGLRSFRLSKSYRAYYRKVKDRIDFVLVERVDKHEY